MEIVRISGSGLGIAVKLEEGKVTGIELTDRETGETAPDFHPEVYRQFKDYLEGKPVTFDLPLDESRLSDFQKRTYAQLVKIPAGSTVSYQQLAQRVATARHSRAVARALAANPFPLAVPCHRVIAKDGSLGGFSCGLNVKVKLLKLEKSYSG